MKTPSEQLEIEDKISHGKQWMACCTICKVSTKMKPMLIADQVILTNYEYNNSFLNNALVK